MSDIRKRRTPGITEHIKAINSLKDEINKIQDTMTDYRQKMQEEYNSTRNASQHNTLLDEKDTIHAEMKNIKGIREGKIKERNEIQDELREIKEELKSQKKTLNFSDPIELAKKKNEIETRMMAEKLTALEEKNYRTILLDMERKSSSFGDLQGKEGRAIELEKKLTALKKEIAELNACLDLRKNEIDELKKHIDLIKEQSKIKSPIVLEYESKINALKLKKEELLEKKKIEHEEIKKKEEEHEKYMQEMEGAIEIENKKKEQRIKIKKLIESLNELEEEKNNFDPNKYDGIIDALKKITDPKIVNINIVQKLSENKIAIPRNKEEIKKSIEILEKKKSEFKSQVEGKKNEVAEKIKTIKEKIQEEKNILENMPKTEINLKELNIREFGFKINKNNGTKNDDFKSKKNFNPKRQEEKERG